MNICLCMIVKNEADVIRRCLKSVKPIINNWVVVDTGSRDGTQDIVRDVLRGIPGQLTDLPWVDFTTNRNQALDYARTYSAPKADYLLLMDADDTLELQGAIEAPANLDLKLGDADSYTATFVSEGIRYARPILIRESLSWHYRGVVHEFLELQGTTKPTQKHLYGVQVRRGFDGARRKDPDCYLQDAKAIESALMTETDPGLISRYWFYLGQSLRDAGRPEAAIEAYRRRVELGGWDQEVFYSHYQIGRLREQLGYPHQEVLNAYALASAACPQRAEAYYRAAVYCRHRELWPRAYQLAKTGLLVERNIDGDLFGEPYVYETGLIDELSVAAYWTGRHKEALQLGLDLLQRATLTQGDRDRYVKNARFALDKL